jgi:hypothetical protein
MALSRRHKWPPGASALEVAADAVNFRGGQEGQRLEGQRANGRTPVVRSTVRDRATRTISCSLPNDIFELYVGPRAPRATLKQSLHWKTGASITI